jgi:hypothetical protein
MEKEVSIGESGEFDGKITKDIYLIGRGTGLCCQIMF